MKKTLIIVYSYHHNNTAKLARAIADVLDADVKTPGEITPEQVNEYELVGFGAGIDSGHHYQPLLDFAKTLEHVDSKRSFIFSTNAIMGTKKIFNDHSALREILLSKGYQVAGEFACKGFNTNSFLKYLGGMNKGRPNKEDINNAKIFAKKLL